MEAKHKLERESERVSDQGRIKEGEREGEERRKEFLLYSLCSTTIQISSSETNSSHSISITRLVLVTQVLNLFRNKVT